MKYYIDFDNTLFDTKRFYNDFLKLISKYDLTEKMINDYHHSSEENILNPLTISKRIVNPLKKEKFLGALNSFFKDLSMYLYDDTISFLEYLNGKSYDVNLLTYGDYDYQKIKIEKSFITVYFKRIIITNKSKDKLDLDYSNACFIDDDVIQLTCLKEKAKVIRIRRKGNKHSILDLADVLEFENLEKYIKFLEKGM